MAEEDPTGGVGGGREIGNDIDFILDCTKVSAEWGQSYIIKGSDGRKIASATRRSVVVIYGSLPDTGLAGWPSIYIGRCCMSAAGRCWKSPLSSLKVTRSKWMCIHSHFKEIGFHPHYAIDARPLTLSVWLCSLGVVDRYLLGSLEAKIEVDISVCVCVCRRLIDIYRQRV